MISKPLAENCRRCARGPLIPRDSLLEGVQHAGRDLCRSCYQWAFHAGRLEDYPRHNAAVLSSAEVAQQYRRLRSHNLTMTEIARRIGIERTALYGALRRTGLRAPRLPEHELARLRAQVGLPAALEKAS